MIGPASFGENRARNATMHIEDLHRYWQISQLAAIAGCFHLVKVVGNVIDDEDGVIEHRVSQLVARRLLEHLEMEVRTAGLDHVPRFERHCVICNHASYLDWAVLLGYFPSPLRFIAKKELLGVPVIGSYLKRRAVMIDRSQGRDALSAIRDGAADDQPWPILLFPEGTRTPDGEMKPFKPGGIKVLAEAGLTMVPVGIWGTYEAFARHARVIKTGSRLRMIIAEPVRPADFGDDTAALAEEVARRIRATAAVSP